MEAQQSLTNGSRLEFLIGDAEEKIRTIYDRFNGAVSVGFSGGRDSTVLLDLIVRTLGEDTPVAFQDTCVEFKETYEFVSEAVDRYSLPNFIVNKPTPKGRFAHQLATRNKLSMEKHGKKLGLWMLAKIRPCCWTLKKYPAWRYMKDEGIQCSIDGRRRSESAQRKKIRNLINEFGDGKSYKFHSASPLLAWKDSDILGYIKKQKLPINKIYDMGYEGCGCAICPCPNKKIDYYSKLFKTHPQWYRNIYKFRPPQPKFYRHKWLEEEVVFG